MNSFVRNIENQMDFEVTQEKAIEFDFCMADALLNRDRLLTKINQTNDPCKLGNLQMKYFEATQLVVTLTQIANRLHVSR
jgi:hypothetical protein